MLDSVREYVDGELKGKDAEILVLNEKIKELEAENQRLKVAKNSRFEAESKENERVCSEQLEQREREYEQLRTDNDEVIGRSDDMFQTSMSNLRAQIDSLKSWQTELKTN